MRTHTHFSCHLAHKPEAWEILWVKDFRSYVRNQQIHFGYSLSTLCMYVLFFPNANTIQPKQHTYGRIHFQRPTITCPTILCKPASTYESMLIKQTILSSLMPAHRAAAFPNSSPPLCYCKASPACFLVVSFAQSSRNCARRLYIWMQSSLSMMVFGSHKNQCQDSTATNTSINHELTSWH